MACISLLVCVSGTVSRCASQDGRIGSLVHCALGGCCLKHTRCQGLEAWIAALAGHCRACWGLEWWTEDSQSPAPLAAPLQAGQVR